MSKLNNRERELVALGAAIASNCVPCIEYHIPEARKSGIKDSQIREAVQIADKVRRVPARAVLQCAHARIDGSQNGIAELPGAGCGCAEWSRSGDTDCVG